MKINIFDHYSQRIQSVIATMKWDNASQLAQALREAWQTGKRVYLCGNGGSAGNAIHLANDFNYGISPHDGIGLRVTALSANSSVLTCIANDISYEEIFSQQIAVQGEPEDILIVLSGSGNSPNIVKVLEKAKELRMKTFAILGYNGGKCKELCDVPIHIPVEDMQISEDMQLIIGHMIMQWLRDNPISK